MVGFFYPTGNDRTAFSADKAYCAPIGINQINLYANYGYTLSQTLAWR
jgi:hypothetical protein